MSTATRTPALKFRYTDANGFPLAGGKVFTYAAGSTTPAATYADQEQTIVNTNPVILDIAGEAHIFLPFGVGFKFVVKNINDAVLATEDNVFGSIGGNNLADITALTATSSGATWVTSVNAPTYVNPTTFILPTNETTNYAVGNRVRFDLVASRGYGTVMSVSYSTPNTTVVIANDTISLDNTVTTMAYSTFGTNNKALDAGAVTYSTDLAYATPGTVGYALRNVAGRASITQNINAGGVPTSGTTSTLSEIYRTFNGPRLVTLGGKMMLSFVGKYIFTVDSTSTQAYYDYNFSTEAILRLNKDVTGLITIPASPRITRVTTSGGITTVSVDCSISGIIDPRAISDGLSAATGYSINLEVNLVARTHLGRYDTALGVGALAPYFTNGGAIGQFAIIEL